ncbi:MAG TPA: gephyrin-like molybdotransferase Glp [Bryobacteraceae bacterium]|nr:gephyrin-like molybdotransferase Glp [Bryobacteraceae bacterium]
MALPFEQARACVIQEVGQALAARRPATEELETLTAAGRVLSEDIPADRDYPPFRRSARDGFAVRAVDLPGDLEVIGEVRAGSLFEGTIGSGQAVEIMTGAPLPEGADAVVMVEHAERRGERVHIARTAKPGENFGARGMEAAQGAAVLRAGQRLGFAEIAALAMVGRTRVQVYRQPRVGIVPTGDEIVEVHQQPEPYQIRNSNAWSLTAQVARAGAEPRILPIARDNYESTRSAAEAGLQCDLLLLSGGVSAGKYDIVERVLADLGARFFFDRVAIQPGQPLVFGTACNTFFFGLPGNPASTMVTFEVFARAAVDLLSGSSDTPLPFLRARLEREVRQHPGLTRFLPARLSPDGASIMPERSQGSGDICALARANAFVVTTPDREVWNEGDDIRVLMK